MWGIGFEIRKVFNNISIDNLECRFLRLLSEYDWTFSPLVVDINNDLGPDDEKEINVSDESEQLLNMGSVEIS